MADQDFLCAIYLVIYFHFKYAHVQILISQSFFFFFCYHSEKEPYLLLFMHTLELSLGLIHLLTKSKWIYSDLSFLFRAVTFSGILYFTFFLY